MYRTKIDWCDSTWNPISGCYHDCPYCYARQIAHRFSGKGELWNEDKLHVLDEKAYMDDETESSCAYPYGFEPTLHRYRLQDYYNRKGRNIFVGSTADIFGSWIPEQWHKEVFSACIAAPQHQYLFLTKSPEHIPRHSYLYSGVFSEHAENFWFGTTITCQKDLEDRLFPLLQVRGHTYLSIEPLHGPLNLFTIWVTEKNKEVYLSLPEKKAYYMGGRSEYRMPEWIIIGAETGRRNGKIIPERKWVEDIVSACRKANIPVFMKNSLQDIWKKELIQEYPKGLQ